MRAVLESSFLIMRSGLSCLSSPGTSCSENLWPALDAMALIRHFKMCCVLNTWDLWKGGQWFRMQANVTGCSWHCLHWFPCEFWPALCCVVLVDSRFSLALSPNRYVEKEVKFPFLIQWLLEGFLLIAGKALLWSGAAQSFFSHWSLRLPFSWGAIFLLSVILRESADSIQASSSDDKCSVELVCLRDVLHRLHRVLMSPRRPSLPLVVS